MNTFAPSNRVLPRWSRAAAAATQPPLSLFTFSEKAVSVARSPRRHCSSNSGSTPCGFASSDSMLGPLSGTSTFTHAIPSLA